MNNKPKLPSTALVIFGAAGDLTWRKLMPALYDLYLDNLLPEKFVIFGVDGKSVSADDWRKRLHDGVNQFSRHEKTNSSKWKNFSIQLIDCLTGDFTKAETFEALAKALKEQDKELGEQAEHVFYLATPPVIVEEIVHNLGQAGLTKDPQRSRLVFEKPFLKH